MRAFHVALDIGDGGFLVAGFGEFKGVFEFALPVAVRRKREAFRHAARRVEAQQLFGHLAHARFDFGAGFGPGGPAHFVERGPTFAFAAKALHEVDSCYRKVELVAARVFEQHVIALGVALRDLFEADELAHAMLRVHHVIAGLEIELIGREGALACWRARGRAWRPIPGIQRGLPSRTARGARRGIRRRARFHRGSKRWRDRPHRYFSGSAAGDTPGGARRRDRYGRGASTRQTSRRGAQLHRWPERRRRCAFRLRAACGLHAPRPGDCRGRRARAGRGDRNSHRRRRSDPERPFRAGAVRGRRNAAHARRIHPIRAATPRPGRHRHAARSRNESSGVRRRLW